MKEFRPLLPFIDFESHPTILFQNNFIFSENQFIFEMMSSIRLFLESFDGLSKVQFIMTQFLVWAIKQVQSQSWI